MSYASKAQVIKGMDGLVADDVHQFWLDNADQEIITRTGQRWEEYTDTILVDGTDEEWIELPIDYVSEVTEILVGNYNNQSVTTVDLTTIQIDQENAILYIHRGSTLAQNLNSDIKGAVWGRGIKNCSFAGTFGKTTPAEIVQLEVMIVWRAMMVTPLRSKMNMDLMRVQTSRWTETYNSKSKSLDDMIEFWFENVVKTTSQLAFGAL